MVIVVILVLCLNRLELLGLRTVFLSPDCVFLQVLKITSSIACPVSINYFSVRYLGEFTAIFKERKVQLEYHWNILNKVFQYVYCLLICSYVDVCTKVLSGDYGTHTSVIIRGL